MSSSEEMSSPEERPEDTDPVRLMACAFDRVLDRLPSGVDRTEGIRREVALFIVDQFRSGEHDPDRLSDLVVAKLGATGEAVDNVTLAPAGEQEEEAPEHANDSDPEPSVVPQAEPDNIE